MARRSYRPRSRRFQSTVARRVKGGIKSQTRRGAFSETWWGTRWISILEKLSGGLESRLARGRAYARKGQTARLSIKPGQVDAEVQGSQKTRYQVSIRLKRIPPDAWKKIGAKLAERPKFAAKLLAGELPQGIEQAFSQCRRSLFPRKRRDLSTACSCPDASNPCKHIAAVYYLLGEAFDGDPFLLFRLRGIKRDDLLTLVAGRRPEKKPTPKEKKTYPSSPLPEDPAEFWGGEVETEVAEQIIVPSVPAALVRRLGRFPLWRGRRSLLEQLKDTYQSASTVGIAIVTSQERQEKPSEDESSDGTAGTDSTG